MLGYFGQGVEIQTGIQLRALQRSHQRFRAGLRGAVGKGAQAGIHNVYPGLGGHKVDHVPGAGGVVGVQMDGHVHLCLELLYQTGRLIGQQQVGHILDADGVCPHLYQFLGQLYKVSLIVNGGDGVAQSRFAPAAVLFGVPDGGLQVAGVVERIKDADHIDAVFNGLAAESFHHVVCIMLVAQNVLAPEQHLQLGVGQGLAQGAQPLPGIFVEVAEAGVKGGAAPYFQRPVADSVQRFTGGQHIADGHTGGRLGLVAVPQDGIGDQQFSCHGILLSDQCPSMERNTPAAMAEPITPATLGPMAFISRKLPGLAF